MKQRSYGFTLLEIMLVILLMALVAVGPLLMIQWDSDDRKIEKESEALLARLQLAREDAVLGRRELGLWVDEAQYGFVLLTELEAEEEGEPLIGGLDTEQEQEKRWGWKKLEQVPFAEHTLPEPLVLELILDGLSAERFDDSLFDDQPEMRIPQVLLLSSGEMTPFEIRLSSDEQPDLQQTILGMANGRLLFKESEQ